MSTFDGALDGSGAFGMATEADVTVGNFFWQPKLSKNFLLKAATILIAVWFVVFSLLIFSLSASSAASNLPESIFKIGYIGDSITVGVGSGESPSATETEVSLLGDTYEAVNKAVNGMATNQWLPGGKNFDSAVAEFKQKNVAVVSIMLGTNDARNDQMTTSVKYVANMRTIIHGLLLTGTIKTVILNYPPYISVGKLDQWSVESQTSLASYIKGIDTLVNDRTVLQGDTASYNYFQTHPDQLADGIHPNANGYAYLGALWAASYERLSATRDNIAISDQVTNLLLQK